MDIKLSIVIPTFKRPGLLFRCLKALYEQEFPSDLFEVIVVTDGPDPDTQMLAGGTTDGGPAVKFISLDRKRGPAAARNAGWRQAGGELILFTDDDCVPDHRWVSAYWEFYAQHFRYRSRGSVPVAFRGPVSVPCPERPTDHERNTAGLETAAFVTANCAGTKSALEKVGGFDESFSMAWREDSDLEFKLLGQSVPILFVPSAIIVHPVRKAPWGISLKEQKKSMYNALLYKKHPALFRQRIYRGPFLNYYAIVILFLIALLAFIRNVPLVGGIAAGGWLVLTVCFIIKRLRGASLSFTHVTEMIVTSILIPFLSIFWTGYGAVRFRTFFL